MNILSIEEFLSEPGAIVDVRSPGEHLKGRIPEAISIPLFSDEERARVGTLYKQTGREQAVELGIELFGPKMLDFVKTAKSCAVEGRVKVHCWRGGMRSSSMAWLFETAGLSTVLLKGGYKAFRQWVLSTLSIPRKIFVLGGFTGCGKTHILHALRAQGEQVLDLEQLAHHRGSSYGMLGQPAQPSSEHFENEIAIQWASFDASRPVWIEDESRLIGTCKIPDSFFALMSKSPLFYIERPKEERIERLRQDYSLFDAKLLIEATERLRRRLGGDRTNQAIKLFETHQFKAAVSIILEYYDATYLHGLTRRPHPLLTVTAQGLSSDEWAHLLLQKTSEAIVPPIES